MLFGDCFYFEGWVWEWKDCSSIRTKFGSGAWQLSTWGTKQTRDSGEPQQKSHSGDTEQKKQVVDHRFFGEGEEDPVTLRSVSDKIDTVMGMVQGMVSIASRTYHLDADVGMVRGN